MKIYSWPRYDHPEELDAVIAAFRRETWHLPGASLHLRYDETIDGPVAQAVAAASASADRVLSPNYPINLDLWDTPSDPAVIAEAVDRVYLSGDAQRQAFLRQVEPEPVCIPALPAHAKQLRAQAQALDPWFFPVSLQGVPVVPSRGGPMPFMWMEAHTFWRETLIIDAVAARYPLKGRSILEPASNCGYWSSRYVAQGANRVLGMEGRPSYVAQAELYWRSNHFLPESQWKFIEGNVSDPAAWEALNAEGPFDLCLCAGILYHVPDYRAVLQRCAALSRDVLVVDTRVGKASEDFVDEPGDLQFNAIAATRRKIVPHLPYLLDCLKNLGFEPEVLPVAMPIVPGVDGPDCYRSGQRVTIFAKRI